MVAAAYLYKGLLDGLERSCYKNGYDDSACNCNNGDKYACHNYAVARGQREGICIAVHRAACDRDKSVFAADLDHCGVPLIRGTVCRRVLDYLRLRAVSQAVDPALENIGGVLVIKVYLEVINDIVIVIGGRIRNSHRTVVERASAGRAVKEALAGQLVADKQGRAALMLLVEHRGVGSAAGGLGIDYRIVVESAVCVAVISAEIVDDLTGLSGASAEDLAVLVHQRDGIYLRILVYKLHKVISDIIRGFLALDHVLYLGVLQNGLRLLIHRVEVGLQRVALVLCHLE